MTVPDAAAGHLDVSELRRIAEQVASAAADLVRDMAREAVEVAETKSSQVDVVTAVDTASEALVRRLLAEARPDDAVLGEEEGASSGSSGVRWVVDPVDGTVNLLYGIDEYAVSLAAEVDGAPVAAAVVHVGSGAVYSAGLGQGATKDGRALRVRPATTVAQSLVLTGFGYRSEVRAHQGACVARLLPLVRDVRRMGSCALDLCHVAEGVADAYVEDGPQPWDYAAGRLVLTEAGGHFDLLPGPLARELDGWQERSVLVASPRETWSTFAQTLRQCGFVD